MKENWRQILTWFESNFEWFRVLIVISEAIFDWIYKQLLNVGFFLLDWYCQKLGITDLLDNDEKVTSDKKMICNLYQRYKGGNTNIYSQFSVIFK